jgi:hypothetical protein
MSNYEAGVCHDCKESKPVIFLGESSKTNKKFWLCKECIKKRLKQLETTER